MTDRLEQAYAAGVVHEAARVPVEIEVVRSWDMAAHRDPALLVPVDVRALVVPAAGGVERVQVLPRPSGGWLTPPTPFAAGEPRAPGVWLHVAMPDALTRAAPRATGDGAGEVGNPMRLPALPNRLLVVRMVAGRATTRSWVLEADRGQRRDLQGWSEPGPAPEPHPPGYIPPARLTATAGGDSAWAACLDEVLNRFALHDDLADLDEATRAAGTFSYLVVGWWSDAALDPVRPLTSRAAFEERLAELRWSLPPSALDLLQPPEPVLPPSPEPAAPADILLRTDQGTQYVWAPPAQMGLGTLDAAQALRTWPGRTLVHGVVTGVRAHGGTVDLRPDPGDVEAAIGGHPFAALAAMLAEGEGLERLGSERLLFAFTSGKLLGIGGADGLVAVDEERHQRQFEAEAGGHRARPDRVADGDPLPTRAAGAPTFFGLSEVERLGLGAPPPGTTFDAAQLLRVGDEARPIGLGAALTTQISPSMAWPERRFRDVPVPLPRFHRASEPAIALRGAARSQRHGGDGNHEPDGALRCRVQLDPGWEGVLTGAELPLGLRRITSGAVPPEADLLLQEAVLTDPSRIDELADLAQARRGLPAPAVAQRLEGEHGFRQFPVEPNRRRSGVLGPDELDAFRAESLWTGDECSPVGVVRWAQPWVPLVLEYEVQLELSSTLRGWVLGETDLEPTPTEDPPELVTLAGRSLLTGTSGRALADGVHQWLAEEDARDAAGLGALTEAMEQQLLAVADDASGLDVLTGSLDALRAWRLGHDLQRPGRRIQPGQSAPDPQIVTGPLRPFTGGRLRLLQARLVDAFGRTLTLPVSTMKLEVAATHAAPAAPRDVLLRPRVTLPSRLMLRFVDAANASAPEEARVDQEHPERAPSPVCGWLLPDHVDEALEVFDAAGAPMGQLFHDPKTGAVLWEGAPGRPGPLGAAPFSSHPAARWVGGLVRGLLAADTSARAAAPPPTESALSALLRAVDTTLWTTDPFASQPSGPIAGLVGRPIAVVRATIHFELQTDLDQLSYQGTTRAERAAACASLAAQELRVRLGEASRTDDGLLAWFVDDDFEHVRLTSPLVRQMARATGPGRGHLAAYGAQEEPELQPIEHPYVHEDADLSLRFGQQLRLTLLMLPTLAVHATTGILPRKRLMLARDWFEAALQRLAPSVRVGPVLFEGDPTAGVHMPRISGLGASQRFTHKPDSMSWRDDAIFAASQTAHLPELRYQAREGWIRVGGEGT
jgi:hypothetical protein